MSASWVRTFAAVAVTVPVVAAATAYVIRRQQPAAELVRVAEYGIRNVPARPPLWRTRGTDARLSTAHPHSVPPVPPENPHAPATPASGIPHRPAAQNSGRPSASRPDATGNQRGAVAPS